MENYKVLDDAALRSTVGGAGLLKAILKYGDPLYKFAQGFVKGFGSAAKKDGLIK